jgi:hypothetical protein
MPRQGSSTSFRQRLFAALAVTGLFIALGMPASPAFALSELKKTPQEDISKDGETPGEAPDDSAVDGDGVPMPGPLINKNAAESQAEDDKAGPPAEIILDMSKLPEPVQKLRVAIVEAAASGDIERLRPLLGTKDEPTQISIGDAPEDPITALKSLSGDPDGREMLAILLDVISTGAALVDKGTPDETYVWPYFSEKSLDSLSPPEIVELYRIVTAADVVDMKEFGGYNFYRVGISPDGKWKFFVAGD